MDVNQLGLDQPSMWLAVLQIIWINILLSGDNAVVIALACRQLPPRKRNWGIALGAGVAVVLRIVFTGIVATLMEWPWLKFAGGLALLYIAVDLTLGDDGDDNKKIKASDKLWRAVATVAIADIVMSLDNVVAIAAVAKGSWLLLILGLTISIPLIVVGAAMITALFDRFPALVWAGAALLGWVAGALMIDDPGIGGLIGAAAVHQWEYYAAAAGAVFVLGVGYLIQALKSAARPKRLAPFVRVNIARKKRIPARARRR